MFISDEFVEELTEFTIETPCPSGFYHPKWNGTEWVEAGQAPEPTPQEPTEVELLMLAVAELADIVMGG